LNRRGKISLLCSIEWSILAENFNLKLTSAGLQLTGKFYNIQGKFTTYRENLQLTGKIYKLQGKFTNYRQMYSSQCKFTT
jgi:hypothetical protein